MPAGPNLHNPVTGGCGDGAAKCGTGRGDQVLQPGRSALAVLAAQLSRGPAAEQMQLSHARHLAQGVELPLPPPCSLHPKTEGRLSCRQRNLGSACAPTVCGAEPGTAKDTLRAGRVATAREVEANSTEGRRAGEVWKPLKPLTRSPFSPLCRQIATPQAWGSWRGSGTSPCRHTPSGPHAKASGSRAGWPSADVVRAGLNTVVKPTNRWN